jgi:phosphatidate phosphatase APP1
VNGMAAWYRCLRGDKAAAPGLVFVSGSPVQYTSRLKSFLARHGFPFGALQLRNLGPSTLHGYKEPLLRRLMKEFPQPLVLVGDSGEHDPEIYRELRREFPNRVRAIFIRDAGRAEEAKRFEGMVLFQNVVDASRQAQALGLESPGCYDRERGRR